MNARAQDGFSLIELLVAATVFTFLMTAVGGLFVTALDLQRRGTGILKIEENAQFALESIAREVRVSTVSSGDTTCDLLDPIATATITIQHPVNGTVTYWYDRSSGTGVLYRNNQPIISSDVDITAFAFCVSGSGHDGEQTRVTMPMTLRSLAGRPGTAVSVSLQTTVISRDLSTDFLP
jgi:prepilin-type N-terminal cleavage/methylation domain-containing protein